MAFEFFKNLIQKLKNKKKKEPKKLGLALGSGGARGLAHIGILRAFEEEGIKFDFVAGSSIGSVIGGLYCLGYSTSFMMSYLKELNLSDPATIIKYKLMGVTIGKLLNDAMGGADFDELKIPFSAVSTDIDSGEEVDIKTGNVANAMCASSAIPPIFKCVTIDEKRLVDGAYSSCVPSECVKNMGADFVIGINLSSEIEDTFLIKTALDGVFQDNKVKVVSRKDKPYKYCDFMFEPDLREYSSASIRNFAKMEEIGYNLAREKMPEIKKMLEDSGIIEKSKG